MTKELLPMRTLYTLAYPTLHDEDLRFIETFRREHDLRYRDVVAAHFTLVFGCQTVTEAEYLEHVEPVARCHSTVRFWCRYAMLGADDRDDTAYVFLVPDEGYGALSLLHDALYTGVLQEHLRLDIPFIPHITIGTLRDRRAAKRLCDELNHTTVGIRGSVNALTVGSLGEGKVQNLASFPLQV